jgi:D-serine deaminase-like pyridoxal phosphate-dependent protein
MRLHELETPALIVDLDVMEANLNRVAAYAREHGLRLRPHTKTHKTPELARMQLASGACGLTVAKSTEAEVMLESGTEDMLVAYPVIGRAKLDRLAEVARKTQLTVALDNLTAARQLSDIAREKGVEFKVLAEADAGLGRVGVPPDEIVGLARALSNMQRLRYAGIAFYPGHIKSLDEKGQEAIEELSRTVAGMVHSLREAGLAPEVVSGGSTPALYESHRVEGLNEIRPGTYIFNDRNTLECGACRLEHCAASLLVTVVSTARKGQLIIDGGSKTFSSDRLASTGEPTFGLIRELPGASFVKMNEEHGYVDLRRAADNDFSVGDRLTVIPNHICVAVNLHEQIYGVRHGEVEHVWKVKGRGKLQ